MRLEGKIKMGYYPTPLSVVERISSFLKLPQDNVNILDPCCGEGLALKKLAEGINATTYGIELDEHRAKQAKSNLDRIITGSYEDSKISNNAFSCLLLNPPYDWEIHSDDADSERKEKTFLKDTVKYLQPSGTLVYIIPQHRLNEDIAKILSYRFCDFNVFRFPDDEYEAQKQIVLFGSKKSKSVVNENDFWRLQSVYRENLPGIPYSKEPLYKLPSSGAVSLFCSSLIDEKELEREMEKSVLWQKFNGYGEGNGNDIGRPPLPLHTGHLGLLLANGCLDGIVGEGEDKHIVRGKVEKVTHKFEEYADNVLIEREVEKYNVSIKLLRKDGEILNLM